MTDTSNRAGGQSPTNFIAGNQYNPQAGPTDRHPEHFPPGTPLAQSRSTSGTVIPARADSVDTASVVGLAAMPSVVGDAVVTQFHGVLTLTAAEWDVVTTQTGGLTAGAVYYLSVGFHEGELTTSQSTTPGDFITQVGIALSPTDMLVQISATRVVE